jgi:hypothetical protein
VRPGTYATLTGRRLTLSLRTPRAILLPLATPVLIAVVIAPALAKTASPVAGVDYMTYLAVGTAALVVPLSCMQAGLGAIVDRNTGARPDLLAAPIPRPLLVFANLSAALTGPPRVKSRSAGGLCPACVTATSLCCAGPRWASCSSSSTCSRC